jgi:hypothetical protein
VQWKKKRKTTEKENEKVRTGKKRVCLEANPKVNESEEARKCSYNGAKGQDKVKVCHDKVGVVEDYV